MNVHCPRCRSTIAIAQTYADQTVACGHCSQTFIVPEKPRPVVVVSFRLEWRDLWRLAWQLFCMSVVIWSVIVTFSLFVYFITR
jgi:DNA-directed RNA polymerase subunit RPC12/RpoP